MTENQRFPSLSSGEEELQKAHAKGNAAVPQEQKIDQSGKPIAEHTTLNMDSYVSEATRVQSKNLRRSLHIISVLMVWPYV